MSLPYPTKVVLPFDIATAQDMNERHANDVALAAGTGLNNGALTYAKLLSTIFSGQVTSNTNPGSAAGTRNYINLGGIKMCWGITNSWSTSTGPTARAITLPAGFFSSITYVNITPYNPSGVATLVGNVQNASTTTVNVYLYNTTGSGTGSVSWFIIGT